VIHRPKDLLQPERGDRPISLINIEDRVVQRALVELLQPLRDPFLCDTVFGFRPRRSRLHALAHLERIAFASSRFVWVLEDIRNAFDQVPRNRLKDILSQRVPSPELVDLIVRLANNGRRRGIQQGGPLSPLLLNEYLDHHLDRPWRQQLPDIPQLRYVDDLLLACRTKTEARQSWRHLCDMLRPAGMPLKGDSADAVTGDLRRGDHVEWLGFEIRRGAEMLDLRIADKAWRRLQSHLILAHHQPDAPLRAAAMANGWVDQMGPCYDFEDRGAVLRRIAEIAREQAFDELPSRAALLARWRRARDRWHRLRDDLRSFESEPHPDASLPPALQGAEGGSVDDGTGDTEPPFDVDD
jgi:hypothetical protein